MRLNKALLLRVPQREELLQSLKTLSEYIITV